MGEAIESVGNLLRKASYDSFFIVSKKGVFWEGVLTIFLLTKYASKEDREMVRAITGNNNKSGPYGSSSVALLGNLVLKRGFL